MNRTATIFLRIVIILIGALALFLMVRLPLTEGRAVNLDLFSIYTDPFILYGFAASIPFFVILYQVDRLLGNIGRNAVFSLRSLKALRTIKYSAITLSILIVLAGIYVRVFHHPDDDPAGFLALGIVTTGITLVIATTAAVFEKILRTAVQMKSENDLTV
ncbi:MAG: DUF2975 domain-containing protein [Candidatus Kerfeldbacteria bacterium]|nr:DUF2975 domain-containing protein [Candidatus Kerfeldbacteria bacterium]